MRPLIVVFALFALPPTVAASEFMADYRNKRAAFQAEVDTCDLINARDVLELASRPLAEIEPDMPGIRHVFDTTASARRACYQAAAKKLDVLLKSGADYLRKTPDDTLFARQMELDGALRAAVDLRMTISQQLLRATLNDVETSLSAYITGGAKQAGGTVFIEESPLTRALIKQDMDLILELERRQLNLDEVRTLSEPLTARALAQLKLAKVHHYLSRALMAFEDMHLTPRLYPLARLNTEFGYANAQFAELFGYAPKLDGVDRALARDIARTADRATVLALDIDGGLRDLRSGLSREDYDNWLSELYQDISALTISVQEHRAALSPHIRRPANTPSIKELEAALDDLQDQAARTDDTGTVIKNGELPAYMLDGTTRLEHYISAQTQGKKP
jgi:hypothetical protein